MPVGERAADGVCSEVGAEPGLLGRAGTAAAGDEGAVGVERDHMPRAELEGVPALPAVPADAPKYWKYGAAPGVPYS